MEEKNSELDSLRTEVEQLREDLEEAREQQRATSDVLNVLGRSESDQQPVFESVVQNARTLCRADTGQIHIFDGTAYHLAFVAGGSDSYQELLEEHPIEPGTGTLVGRVGLEGRTIHIPDVIEDPYYQWEESLRRGGQRTMLGVPIRDDGDVIGVVSLARTEVAPFSKRQIDLVTTFAAQGAIAIQNGNLFKRLESAKGRAGSIGGRAAGPRRGRRGRELDASTSTRC